MWSNRKIWSFFLFVFLFLPTFSSAQEAETEGSFLFTAKEAEQLRHAEDEWKIFQLTRAASIGPRILVQRPLVKGTKDDPLIEMASPADFFVSFERNRAPVNMESLEIRAKKGFFSKSLTGKLRPYVQGTSLQAKGIKIPSGRFVIQITIADNNGAKTEASYRVSVKNQE